MKRGLKVTVSIILSLYFVFALLPNIIYASDTSEMPSANGVNFFANGTPITICADVPANAVEVTDQTEGFSSFTSVGTDACIVWKDGEDTKYFAVNNTVRVYGGKDGSSGAVNVPSTEIMMTGGTIFRLYGGNKGQDNTNPTSKDTLTVPSKVTGNVTINITGSNTKVTDYIVGAGHCNAAVEGKVTINIDGPTDLYSSQCYINGGVHGNGKEGYYDASEHIIYTNAVAAEVEITLNNTHAFLVAPGGGGYTKVNSAIVSIGDGTGSKDTQVDFLFCGGVNGYMVGTLLNVNDDAKIDTLAATNRGLVGTATVNVLGADITNLYTMAIPNCFSSDGDLLSAVEDEITYNFSTGSSITNAVLTPNALKTADNRHIFEVGKLILNNTSDSVLGIDALEVSSFDDGLKNDNVIEFLVSEETELVIDENINVTVPDGISLKVAGDVTLDGKISVASGGNVIFEKGSDQTSNSSVLTVGEDAVINSSEYLEVTDGTTIDNNSEKDIYLKYSSVDVKIPAGYSWVAGDGYNIFYSLNSGTGNIPQDNTKHDANSDVSVLFTLKPSKDGYRFLGWMDSAELDTNTKTYSPPQGDAKAPTFKITDNTVLYARYEKAGDINLDKKTSIEDISLLIDLLLKRKTPSDIQYVIADTNGNGSLSIEDISKLIDIILGR